MRINDVNNQVVTGDFVRLARELPAGCARLVFADVEYRRVDGYPEYFVGEDGSVWSIKNRGRKLKPRLCTKGYHYVALCDSGVARNRAVHRLVLIAFRGKPNGNQQALHSDGNKTNNTLRNLRWGTQAENEQDKEEHGTANNLGGAKIDKETAELARSRVLNGETQRAVANNLGVTPSNMCVIMKGGSW